MPFNYSNSAIAVTTRRQNTLRVALLGGASNLINTYSSDGQGFAMDFTKQQGQAYIFDTGTPANNVNLSGASDVDGLNSVLTYTSPSPKMITQSDGAIKYATHNLWKNSETFESATSAFNSNASVSGNVISISAADAYLYRYYESVATSGLDYSVMLDVDCSASADVGLRVIDHTDAEISQLLVSCSAGVTQRVTISGTAATGGNFKIGVDTRSAVITGADDLTGETVTFNRVQVSRYPASTQYLSTTSTARYALAIDPDGLLEEPAATNLVTNSNSLLSWTQSGQVPVGTKTTGIDGLQSGWELEASGSGIHSVYPNSLSVTATETYTFSFYAKEGTTPSIGIMPYGANGKVAKFNLSTETFPAEENVGGSSDTIDAQTMEALPNGWYKLSATYTWGTTRTVTPYIYILDASDARIFTAGATAETVEFQQFGAETGSVATSPIITAGSTVTRAADNLSIATSAFPYADAGAGTLYYDFAAASAAVNVHGGISLYYNSSNKTDIRQTTAFFAEGGVTQSALGVGSVTTSSTKRVSAFAANDFAATYDGNAVATDTSGTVGVSATALYFATDASPSLIPHGHIKSIAYIPERVSNANLQAMTEE